MLNHLTAQAELLNCYEVTFQLTLLSLMYIDRKYVIVVASVSHHVCHEDLRRARRPPANIDYEVGDLVEVARRSWPGINKPGGAAKIKCKREGIKH